LRSSCATTRRSRRLEIAEPYPVTAKVQALVDELRELRERLEGQRAKLEEVLA
jgi:hypothetical protein